MLTNLILIPYQRPLTSARSVAAVRAEAMQTEAMQRRPCRRRPRSQARELAFITGRGDAGGKTRPLGTVKTSARQTYFVRFFSFFFFLLFLHLLVRKSAIITSFNYSLATENCFRLTNLLITFSVVDLIVKTLHLGIFRLHKINSGRAVHHTMSLIY